MGKRGPLPQGAAAAWLKGSGPQPTPSQPANEPPEMPEDLPPEACPIWRGLVPQLTDLGIVTPLDTIALGDMCICIARLAACEKDITSHGILVDGRWGKVRNPALQAAREYRAALQNWARRFGLTPGDRDRIEIPEDEEDHHNPLLDFIREGRTPKESQAHAVARSGT